MSEDVIHTPTIEADAEATRRIVTTEEPRGEWLVVRVFVCGKAVYAELGKNEAEIAKVREDAVYCAKSWHQELAHALFVYAEKREHAAYERGKAEGREAERGRVAKQLNARKQTAAINEERAVKEPNWDRAVHYQRMCRAIEDLINIVNQE